VEKQPVISQEEFRQQYNERKPHYERLAANLQAALKMFLTENQIPYLEVLARVKEVDSAYEKIARKEYERPFEQIEDWCGLRIICYYPSDIDRICDFLQREFIIQTQEDTAKRLAAHEFGYRSTHFILQVKPSWTDTPNYRALQNFKAEVQVRTILMHAWAEIEHKLSYKSAEQVPDQFRRKLFRLSAKFEEADEQFEELRNGIGDYRAIIQEAVKDVPSFRNQELNLDTLQAFLDTAFPDREIMPDYTGKLLSEFKKCGMTMSDVIDGYETAKDTMSKFELHPDNSASRFTQVGALRTILDVGSDKYFAFRYAFTGKGHPSDWINLVKTARSSIGLITPEIETY
jgi:putative GTP pyrophosphokinase